MQELFSQPLFLFADKKKRGLWRSALLFLISFFLVAFGQPAWIPLFAPFAALVGYALIWRSLQTLMKSGKELFWGAAIWFFAVQLVQLSWMTSWEFQGYYIFFVYAGLSLGMGLQFGLLSLIAVRSSSWFKEGWQLDLLQPLLLASVWTLLEWSRYFFLCGFSWNPVGLSLSASLYSLQFASVWGVLGLSFWVIVTNAAAWRLLQEKIRPFPLFFFFLTALIPSLFGLFHLHYHEADAAKDKSLRVALVQTALLPSQKIPIEGRFQEFFPPLEQWRRVVSLLSKINESRVDLIVLPESALPFFWDEAVYPLEPSLAMLKEHFSSEAFPRLQSSFSRTFFQDDQVQTTLSNAFFAKTIANHFQAGVVAGFDSKERGNSSAYNAALHISPHAQAIGQYEKRILMPLAEYLPSEALRSLAKRYGVYDFFERGKEAVLFQEGELVFSPLICYEETFPQLVRESRIKGAHLLVSLTNDNWYPDSRLPQQHFDLARMRAVENGVPLIRSCNSGVTAVVDSLGRTVATLGKAQGTAESAPGVLLSSVPSYHYNTLYLIWGNKGILCLSALGVVVALFFSQPVRSRCKNALFQ